MLEGNAVTVDGRAVRGFGNEGFDDEPRSLSFM